MSGDFPFELASFVRHTDPPTSQQAAASKDNRLRWGSQRYKLLVAFSVGADMTDEEAGKVTGLYAARACYWKRCGELRDLGLISDTGRTRPSDCGHEVIVSCITRKGLAALADVEAQV
jgi:hypothetical protein